MFLLLLLSVADPLPPFIYIFWTVGVPVVIACAVLGMVFNSLLDLGGAWLKRSIRSRFAS